jgi:hypothetical protein
VRGDVPADELAAFCVWGLTGAAVHSSKAAARRLVTVTMDGLRSPADGIATERQRQPRRYRATAIEPNTATIAPDQIRERTTK